MNNFAISILSCCLVMLSCTKNEDSTQESDKVVFRAAIENVSVKSHLDAISGASVAVLFDASDEIAVINASTTAPAKFTTGKKHLIDGGHEADFYGNIEEKGPFCAIFPYEYADKSSSVDRLVLNVPGQQTYSEHSFGISSNIAAAAWPSGNAFEFQSLFGCIKLALKGDCSVKKITIEDNDSESVLWGTVSAIPDPNANDITDISVSNPDEGKNVLTVVLDAAVALTADDAKDFFFVVPEGSFAKGLTMTVYDSNGQSVKTISLKGDLSVSRQSVRTMDPVTISDAVLFSGGSGTEADPYLISSADDLNLLASYVNSGSSRFSGAFYSQAKNIDDAALVNHIGSYGSAGNRPFSGVYDGNGYTISGISFSAAASEPGQGLFGYAKNAVIRNVVINGFANSASEMYSGVLVGFGEATTVQDCSVSGNITINGAQGGGIVGRNGTDSVIDNCKFSGSLSGTAPSLGGIAGLNAVKGRVTGCKVNAEIKASGSGSGGVVGTCESNLPDAIKDCEFNGSISSTTGFCGGILGQKTNNAGGIISCITHGSVSGTANVGGIVGAVSQNSTSENPSAIIADCTNGAEVGASGENAGGVLGYACPPKGGCYTRIDKCANKADITAGWNVGGILGYALNKGDAMQVFNSVTSDCRIYAKTADPSNHYARVGGIVGGTAKASTAEVNIINCCSINVKLRSDDTGLPENQRVSGIAGIIGSLYCAGNIASCYSNAVTSDFSVPNGTIYFKGSIVGYNKGTIHENNYYDSACSYGAFYNTNPCVALSRAQFTDGTLLAKLNQAAAGIEGAATWLADEKSGYPVPSGVVVDPEEPDNTIRILAIGNSFTVDAVEQYLYELFEAAGYNAIIGNCVIGGCTLEKHWNNESSPVEATRNSNSYRKIVKGIKSTTADKSIEFMLRDEPWDYVIFQQGQGLYGDVESHYPYLDNFLDYLPNYLTPGTYRTGYQMTWAFPKDCTNARFDMYDKDQDKMYKACSDCAKTLKTRSGLDVIIPTGTAIQNGRQSELGDTFNRDWGHLDYYYGRYTASCTWFEQITGIDVRTTTYRPSTVTESQAVICRKAAHDAVMNPYEVTNP